jgi:hypothetical protein
VQLRNHFDGALLQIEHSGPILGVGDLGEYRLDAPRYGKS